MIEAGDLFFARGQSEATFVKSIVHDVQALHDNLTICVFAERINSLEVVPIDLEHR